MINYPLFGDCSQNVALRDRQDFRHQPSSEGKVKRLKSCVVQLLLPECVGAAVSPAGRGVEDTTLLLCYHNTLLPSPFS